MLAPLAALLVQPVISSVVKGISGRGVRRAVRGYIDDIWIKFLVSLYSLNDININNCFNYDPGFNGVFSRNNLPRIKDRAYVVNLDDRNSKGMHEISLFIDRNLVAYFDSFGIEYIPQEVLNKIKDKSITHNIFRIQDNESIMCGFCCITFIEYMLAGKTLLEYTNLFSLNDYKKNDKIIRNYFWNKYSIRSKSRI